MSDLIIKQIISVVSELRADYNYKLNNGLRCLEQERSSRRQNSLLEKTTLAFYGALLTRLKFREEWSEAFMSSNSWVAKLEVIDS